MTGKWESQIFVRVLTHKVWTEGLLVWRRAIFRPSLLQRTVHRRDVLALTTPLSVCQAFRYGFICLYRNAMNFSIVRCSPTHRATSLP